MAAALRVGLIGAGNISRAHVPAYRDYSDVVALTAVCDAHAPNAQRVAHEFGHSRIWEDYERFVVEAPVDAVDICLPHHLHYPVAKAALEAGKHVLVEKPFAITMRQCVELVELAERCGRTLMVAQVQRYHATYHRLRTMIQSGALGTIRHARIDALQNLHDYAEPPHWLYDGRQAGGGVVISVAVHKIDLLRYLVGDAVRVAARGFTVDPAFIAAEDYCLATLELENGALVDLFSTYAAAALPYSEMFWIFGDRGVVHTLPPAGQRTSAQPRIAFKQGTKSGREFMELEPAPGVYPSASPFVNEILHFAACCTSGQEPLSSGRDNLKTMAVVFAIYESMRQDGRPVPVPAVLEAAGASPALLQKR
jgi:predicted dehydrogenase